jgi:hypothetical protein
MPTPAKAAASNRGLAARFTRKLGPLPVWAWAAVILGLYLVYTHFHASTGAAASTADTTAVPAAGGDGSAQVPSSGQGGTVDNLNQDLFDQLGANTAAIDQLTAQLLQNSIATVDMGSGIAPGAVSQAGPASTQSTPLQIAKIAAAPHQTQTASGVLSWDGISFTSRAAFDKWAKQHGTTSQQIFKKHPAAKNIYSTLKP